MVAEFTLQNMSRDVASEVSAAISDMHAISLSE